MEKFQGGSIQQKYKYWTRITTNSTVLNWIENGVTIPFTSTPKPFQIDNPKFSLKEWLFLDQEISRLLKSGCIESCSDIPQFVSPIKTVPKKKSFRLITDFRHLNSFCQAPKFVYESIDEVIQITEPSDQCVSWDLESG